MRAKRSAFLLIGGVLAWWGLARAGTGFYVDAANGADGNDGTSWARARATIGAALALATTGDTVRVAAGTYAERITLNGDVTLRGGYPPGGGVRDVPANETIIDGQRGGSVITTRVDRAPIIDGFTITGGLAQRGGGIYGLGSAVFRNLKVQDNRAEITGGGFYCGQNVTIEGCEIVNNRAWGGPAIAIVGRLVDYQVTIRGNVIRGNSTLASSSSGGAVVIRLHMHLDFSRNLVVDNATPDGGVYIEESYGAKVFDHNTIARNGKRGLSLEMAFDVTVTNSIIYSHSLADVFLDTLSNPTLRYSDIGLLTGRYESEHLISVDPQFADTAAGDYSLLDTSPCVDAGEPSWPLDADGSITDLGALPYLHQPVSIALTSLNANVSGNAAVLLWTAPAVASLSGFVIERGRDGRQFSRIGFIEARPAPYGPVRYRYDDEGLSAGRHFYRLKMISNGGTFRFSDIIEVQIMMPKTFHLSQNHPNPFRGQTVIRYSLPQPAALRLEVYDILGGLVATLKEEARYPAGEFSLPWTGTDQQGRALPTGMYLCRMEAGSHVEVRRMVIIR